MTITIADLERPDPALRVPTDIEDLLVWTYRDQRADVVIRNGVGLHDTEAAMDESTTERGASSTCGCAALERIGRAGCRVDGGGMSADHLHEDAERIHRAVELLALPIAALVIRNARISDQPDCMAGVMPRPCPMLNPRRQVSVRCDAWDRNRDYGWCPVEWTPSQMRIDAAREEYALWWQALRSLAGWVRRDLVRYRATGPAISATPWVTR